MSLYQLQDLLPHEIVGKHATTKVRVPEWVFRPDHWTSTFLRGLIEASKGLKSAKLWEVGVGTGINLIALSEHIPGATWYFSDYNPACVQLAHANLRRAGLSGASYKPLGGRRNLVYADGSQKVPEVDVVFGCLPQVPTTKCLESGDSVAHYYDPHLFPCSRRHAYGLVLNEALLSGAKTVLPRKDGKVILNLSGRPGEARLHGMFEEYGYTSRVLYETVVPQHPGTSLESLALIESNDELRQAFEFFTDLDACNTICANHAEERRKRGLPVYHKIFVIEGTLQ